MTNTELLHKIKQCIHTQLTSLANSNPTIAFIKPLICRVLENKLEDLLPYLDMLADKNGNINISDIVEEMHRSLMASHTFTLDTPLGSFLLGDSKIEMDIPFLSKKLVLNRADIDNLKVALIR